MKKHLLRKPILTVINPIMKLKGIPEDEEDNPSIVNARINIMLNLDDLKKLF